jgi:hypothetical protein
MNLTDMAEQHEGLSTQYAHSSHQFRGELSEAYSAETREAVPPEIGVKSNGFEELIKSSPIKGLRLAARKKWVV